MPTAIKGTEIDTAAIAEWFSTGMAFGVFIHRSDSIYDDTPAERYQFPRQYLERVKACVGDWIIYYEPRKVIGTKGYHAVAKVERVIPDRAGQLSRLRDAGSVCR